MRRNLPPSGKTQRVSGTCGFLGSSLASSFLPLQLFFGTWQNAHLKSCLRSGSVELRIERKAQNKQQKHKQQFKQPEMIKSPSGVLSDESMQTQLSLYLWCSARLRLRAGWTARRGCGGAVLTECAGKWSEIPHLSYWVGRGRVKSWEEKNKV